MKPATLESAEVLELRRQLILAQVRLMERQDACDELTTKLAWHKKALEELQRLAQTITSERDHLVKLKDSLAAQAVDLTQRINTGEEERKLLASSIAQLEGDLAQIESTLKETLERLTDRENQFQTVIASRSWRWTKPLRWLARQLRL